MHENEWNKQRLLISKQMDERTVFPTKYRCNLTDQNFLETTYNRLRWIGSKPIGNKSYVKNNLPILIVYSSYRSTPEQALLISHTD